jgi:hypothetical protein
VLCVQNVPFMMSLNVTTLSHRKPLSSEPLCYSRHTLGHDERDAVYVHRVQRFFTQYATQITVLLTRHFSAIGTVPVHVTALALHLPTYIMQPVLAQDMWAPWAG